MACKRLPNTATKQELRDAHRIKMKAKEFVREQLHQEFKADYEQYKEWIAAKAESLVEKRQHTL